MSIQFNELGQDLLLYLFSESPVKEGMAAGLLGLTKGLFGTVPSRDSVAPHLGVFCNILTLCT